MRNILTLIAAAGAALAGATADAAENGRLGTLPVGQYLCALPGDATGAAWRLVADKSFTISNGSTYYAKDGAGTYLLLGDRVTFTRGPMNHMRFKRIGNTSIQMVDDKGELTDLRCVRQGGSF